MDNLTRWANAQPYLTPAVAVTMLLLATGALWSGIRAIRTSDRRPPAAVLVTALAAAACTAYSGDTSWRFAAHKLGMAAETERAALFAAAELALIACALMARTNLHATGAPGTPGVLVWCITSVQIIPAFSESEDIWGGIVRAVLGPVLAAVLWHLVMGIELRHAKPGTHSSSLPAVIARELRERMLSRLGLAARDRTAEQITRDRWTVRAVALAARIAELEPGRRRVRLARKLSKAVSKAGVGDDPEQRRRLLELLAARRNAAALATVDLPSPWHVEPVKATLERVPAPAVPEAVPVVPKVRRELEPNLAVPEHPLDFIQRKAAEERAHAAQTPRTRQQVRAKVRAERPEGGPDSSWTDEQLVNHAAQSLPLIPTVRALKTSYRIGQERAKRIRAELKEQLKEQS